MLRLTFEQAELIDQLLLKRHAGGIALVLKEAWPTVSEQLKERWPAFVEAALQHGHRHGLEEPADLARYACLWCIWGATFDEKPGFDWAREILVDTRRSAALKVHQLIHRTRADLQRQQPRGPSALPVVSATQFDAALARVEQQMALHAAAKAIFLDVRPAPPVKACDLSTLDLMVAEVENLQEYKPVAGAWQRSPVAKLAATPEHWTHAPEEPLVLAVPSHALRAGPAARLNLKLQPLAVCDPRVHPEVVHSSEQGRLSWKGRDTARLSLALYAKPVPLPDLKAGHAGIAALSEADVQQVEIETCGLRDAGAPFGGVSIELQVVPAVQWFTEVRHAGFPAMQWPASGGTPPPAPQAVSCRLEADGVVRDAVVWQRAWVALQPQFRQGMEKLFNAWLRVMDGTSARLEVEAAPLSGQAGLTWGWRRTSASTVAMRTEGQLDLLACAIDLRLAGEVAIGAARARLSLTCKGRSELRMAVAQLGETAPDGQGLAAVKRAWRFPFSLDVDTVAGGELATLSASALPEAMLGAIAGECGLRPRPDGQGLQWYFSLRLEPVTVALVCADPLLGASRHQRTLLAAMPLVDWSAG
jgi:hypothetical protein